MFLPSASLKWIAAVMLVGCAAPVRAPVTAPPSAAARPAARLSLEVLLLKPEGGTKSVGRGDSLKAGDSYNLRVFADRPAYLNVVLTGSGGPRTLLAQQDAPAQPGTPTIIPDDAVLTLPKDGPARVYVIATPQPLTPAQLQDQLAHARAASAEDVRDPPPIAVPSNRPGEPHKLQLTSFDYDGTAALWFVLPR